MKTNEYKKICNQPNAFSRRDLETAERILRRESSLIALRLSETLKTPIIKPVKHKGDKYDDYFLINLPESNVETIIDIFTDLEADDVENNGETTSSISFYAGTADRWMNYLTFINS